VAARDFHDLPAIILDFGTATTFDLIGKGGAYQGGIIAPGVNLSVEALYMAAARLPRLAVEPWAVDMPVLGKDTVSAMHSGIFWGYVSMVEGLIERLRRDHGKDLPAIATGGLAPLFAEHVKAISIVDPDLTLKGLVRIHAQNKTKPKKD
jgi:type III pantothenate kinase